MNWMLIGVLTLLLIMTVVGYKKGFIRKLVGIVAWILTLVLVSIALPYVTEFMRESIAFYTLVQEYVAGSDMEVIQMLRIVGMEEVAGGAVADKMLSITAFVITFILVSVVVHGVAWALRIASRLPVLKGTNRLLGALAGFLEGLFLVWIAFLIVGAGSATNWGIWALYMIADNPVLTWLFSNNPILLFLSA